jgi:GNAT superfamily N-acetyltransferase
VSSGAVLFETGDCCAKVLGAADLPTLQQFFDENPEYFLTVNGLPPRAGEARLEFEDRPPPDMPYDRIFVLGFHDPDGRMVAMASLLSDFLAPRVWHLGLFIVASALHGTGIARRIYAALEAWMRSEGAAWVRLGAVLGNAKAERFWERAGYREVRRRNNVEAGNKVHTVRVFAKPLSGGSMDEYLHLVERDRPEP